MIDIEAAIFTSVYNAVIAVYPSADISSTYVETPSAFPHVSLVEVDNQVYQESQTLGGIENHARLLYQADIYSNNSATAKSICKGIAQVIDDAMVSNGFQRITASQIPNIDRTLYRITLRYQGVVSKGIESGDNTNYLIYTS